MGCTQVMHGPGLYLGCMGAQCPETETAPRGPALLQVGQHGPGGRTAQPGAAGGCLPGGLQQRSWAAGELSSGSVHQLAVQQHVPRAHLAVSACMGWPATAGMRAASSRAPSSDGMIPSTGSGPWTAPQHRDSCCWVPSVHAWHARCQRPEPDACGSAAPWLQLIHARDPARLSHRPLSHRRCGSMHQGSMHQAACTCTTAQMAPPAAHASSLSHCRRHRGASSAASSAGRQATLRWLSGAARRTQQDQRGRTCRLRCCRRRPSCRHWAQSCSSWRAAASWATAARL